MTFSFLICGLLAWQLPAKPESTLSQDESRAAQDESRAAQDESRAAQQDNGVPQPASDGSDIGVPDPRTLAANALRQIADEMRSVQDMLDRNDTTRATQDQQDQILSMMDHLLQLEPESQPQPQPQTKKEQTQQAQQAQQKTAQDGDGEASEQGGQRSSDTATQPDTKILPHELVEKVWGHLPDKLRDQMQVITPERFLPKYELEIEKYYNRLANEVDMGQ